MNTNSNTPPEPGARNADAGRVPVAIVGAGIAGLAAAWELQRRGVACRVFEAAARPGGVIVSVREDGWVIDGGPDALLVQKPAAVALCRELGLGDRLIHTRPPRTAYVLRGGRLHPLAAGSFLGFPLSVGALARASLFSVRGRVRMAAELFVPPRRGTADESIGAFVGRRFGREAVEYLAEPLLAGIHAGDVDRLSMRALFPRLLEAEQKRGSVIRAFRALHTAASPQGAFVSLPGGIGELVHALAAALGPETVRLATPVTALARTAEGFTLEAGGASVQARAVIVAIPAYAAASLLRPLDHALAELAGGIGYASTATVAFGYRRDQVAHPMIGTGFVVPRAEGRALLAGTWVTSKWPGRAPDGHVLLRGFLGGGRDPRRLEAADEDLIAIARGEFEALLGISGAPRLTRLFRWTRASPQYEVGHLDRVAAIDARIASHPGLFLAGSGFHAIGIPDCVADGRETAALAAAAIANR